MPHRSILAGCHPAIAAQELYTFTFDHDDHNSGASSSATPQSASVAILRSSSPFTNATSPAEKPTPSRAMRFAHLARDQLAEVKHRHNDGRSLRRLRSLSRRLRSISQGPPRPRSLFSASEGLADVRGGVAEQREVAEEASLRLGVADDLRLSMDGPVRELGRPGIGPTRVYSAE